MYSTQVQRCQVFRRYCNCDLYWKIKYSLNSLHTKTKQYGYLFPLYANQFHQHHILVMVLIAKYCARIKIGKLQRINSQNCIFSPCRVLLLKVHVNPFAWIIMTQCSQFFFHYQNYVKENVSFISPDLVLWLWSRHYCTDISDQFLI